MRRRALSSALPWLASALLAACTGSAPPAREAARASIPNPPPPPAAPTLPPGVLAEAAGVQGLVRVEERERLRLLTIDGVVQAAVPVGRHDIVASADPLVTLVRAARPNAKTVLVIGLGSGRTAAALKAEGLDVVHPDAANGVPKEIRGDAPTDSRLPFGGALYDLVVDKVLFTFDRSAWSKEKTKLSPIVVRTVKAIGAHDFDAAAKSVVEYLAIMRRDLGPFAEQLAAFAEVSRVQRQIERESAAVRAESAFVIAKACDRAGNAAGIDRFTSASEDAKAFVSALRGCARRGYREARQKESGEGASTATARLYALLQDDMLEVQPSSVDGRRIEAEIAAIEKSSPEVQPLQEPPSETSGP